MTRVGGSCFCQLISYSITAVTGIFQYCHCSRCRKVTGGAFAANIIIPKEDFKWHGGTDSLVTYHPEDTRYFTTAFCSRCGSTLPWMSKNAKVMVIPAGTLDGDPEIKPQQQIFCDSQASWYISDAKLPAYGAKPDSKGS